MVDPLPQPPAFRPSVFWFYGLSGAGKTTIATHVAQALRKRGIPVITLDGDELRSGLNADLGFSIEARTENIRRAAEVAKLACSQGNVVLAAFITPTAELRGKACAIVTPHPFAEIYLACDYATSAQRDPKGLYAKAAAGTLTQFTGRDSAFEVPECADLTINTARDCVDDCVEQVLEFVKHRISA